MKQPQHMLFIRQPSVKYNALIITFTILSVKEYTENSDLSDISETLTFSALSSFFNVLDRRKCFSHVLLSVLPMSMKLYYIF